MGVTPGLAWPQSHHLHEPFDPIRLFVLCSFAVDGQGFGNDIADPLPGIEGGIRVLVNNLGLPPERL